MTTATLTPDVVGVVLQLSDSSTIDSTFTAHHDAPLGQLVFGRLDDSGVTVVFTSARAVERTLDQLRHLQHAFAGAERAAQEEQAWAEHHHAPTLTAAGLAAVSRPLQLVRS
jgi:hypothetical protein